MKMISTALILVLLAAPLAGAQTPPPAAQPVPTEAESWRRVAGATPLGSRVKVETFERRKYHGTLMQATDTAIVIKRSTRLPEPPVTIPYDQLARLEQDRGGVNVAKAIGIGLAAGAGAVVSLILFALAVSD